MDCEVTFSIITPSLQRKSLIDLCESINAQTYTSWQHVVAIDCAILDEGLFQAISHPQRKVYQCDYPHRNYGNTCRRKAWEYATGKWLWHCDDDNVVASPETLQSIADALEDVQEKWAIFPIMRHGWYFFNDPPGLCRTDTMNVVARREVAQWPEMPDYTADGHWVEALKANHPFASFPNMKPIGVMEKSNEGRP